MECRLQRTTVHYETLGQGRPVFMLHPWMANRRVMQRTFEPIFGSRNGWKRIYLDLPGMGKTAGEKWITSEDQVLEIVSEFVDHVVAGERFVVTGMSYGGYLAQGLIRRRSELIDGLLLVAPMTVPDHSQRTLPPHVVIKRDEGVLSALSPDERGFFEENIVVQSPEVLAWVRDTATPPEEMPDEEFLARLRRNYAFTFDISTSIPPFHKPTLIVTGRQDFDVGYIDTWKIVELYPRATFAVLDRAGHFVEIEQNVLFTTLVNEWLDRVAEGLGSPG